MTSPQALAASPKTFAERDNWMRAVIASDLPPIARVVAIRIALHLRITTGRCDPSFPTLAAESHISERTTYRLVDLLEHSGWIAVTRASGRGNQYTLVTPDRTMAGVTSAKGVSGVPLTKRAPTPDRAMTKDPCHHGGRRKAKRTTKRTTKGKEARLAPRGAAPDLKGDARDPAFAEFYNVYPRKVEEDAAHKAWVSKVVGGGVDAASVIARAKLYAVERADAESRGDDPCFTLFPATWLKKRKWTDPPPTGVVIDQHGNVVAIEPPQPQRRNGPLTWADLARGGYDE
jgi:hypothetical protein